MASFVGLMASSRFLGTNDFLTTALRSHLYNGGFEHGPHGFHVPNLPRDVREIHPEVGVEDPTDRGLFTLSQFTLTYRLGLPGLFGSLPCHVIQFIDQLTALLQCKLILEAN